VREGFVYRAGSASCGRAARPYKSRAGLKTAATFLHPCGLGRAEARPYNDYVRASKEWGASKE